MFAKKVGFPRANAKGLKASLRYLERKKVLMVGQGGYRGHSMCHHKIVIVYDWETVKLHFQANPHMNVRQYPRLEKATKPKVEPKFCVSLKECVKQVLKRNLPYSLCKMPGVFCKEQVGAQIGWGEEG